VFCKHFFAYPSNRGIFRAPTWFRLPKQILHFDLNDRAGAGPVAHLEDGGLRFAPVAGSTYHFNRGLNLFGAIDHLGSTANLKRAAGPYVLRQKFRGEWPTDHYLVFADYLLP
jgi:hypothetical protein